jgi:hypothetical protein
MVFENEVVRRIFGCKREKVTRDSLHNEGFIISQIKEDFLAM